MSELRIYDISIDARGDREIGSAAHEMVWNLEALLLAKKAK